MAEFFRVLAIDGGGVRGIIPAMVLHEFEQRSGKPVHELFDLIAGTSTGGILTLSLVRPQARGAKRPKYSAIDIVGLYEEHSAEIFHQPFLRRIPGADLFEERYPADGLERVLKKYLGNARLADALTPVLITAYAIERRMPFFFKTTKAQAKADYNFPMTAVARATSAAPTYFEPARLADLENAKEYYALVDGGVYANNPSACALAEALSSAHEAPQAKTVLVSLGTGEHTRRIPYDEAKDWGLARWARPIISVIMDGVSDSVSYQVQHILPDKHYQRFQIRLNEGNDDMDDASRTNLRVLKLLAEGLVQRESNRIDKTLELLT